MSERAFDPSLASNLVKYAEQLLAKGDFPNALEAAEEAAGVYEELLGSDRTATEPLLAYALRIGAAAYSGQERFSEALASAQRAKDLYESAF
jgi:tetratricopeptide (TPR) repeat protein